MQIGACSNILDLRVLESLFINRLKPVFNSDKTVVPLLIVKEPLLNVYFLSTVFVSFPVTSFIAEDEIFPETFLNDKTKLFVTILILKFIIKLRIKQVKDVPIYMYVYAVLQL